MPRVLVSRLLECAGTFWEVLRDISQDLENSVRAKIFVETYDFETIFSSIDYMTTAVNSWAVGRKPAWKRMYEAIGAEYAAIENYSMFEESRAVNNRSDKYSISGQNTGDSDFHEDNRTPVYSNNADGISKKLEHSGHEYATNHSESTNDETMISDGNIHRHGNIGVTTSQQMLQSEIELRKNTALEKIIVNEFIAAFCVGVY